MKIKERLTALGTGLLLSFSLSTLPFAANAASNYRLASFNVIRNLNVNDLEREAGIINFNEYLKLYLYTYYSDKSRSERDKEAARINSEIGQLKYAEGNTDNKKPPVILHWTDSSNSLGVIKTLFQKHSSMMEGVIGVDYVVTEALKNPDYPGSAPRAYAVKLSQSDVATTWFHVPDQYKYKMSEHDRKYNKAINIEIVGWRFFQNSGGRKGDFGRYGQLGIRETFNGNFNNFEKNYEVYPTVLKLLNYLAEKHGFAKEIDNYNSQDEISSYWKNRKGITYLDGPLSQNIKGHGLIALEHSLMFGSKYKDLRHDFTPNELLTVYEDLKNFRSYYGNSALVKKLEEQIRNTKEFSSYQLAKIKEDINTIQQAKKREYLLYALYMKNEKITDINKLNETRKYLEYLDENDREKLTSTLISKYINESDIIGKSDYHYLKNVISTVKDNKIKNQLEKTLFSRFAYQQEENNSPKGTPVSF